MGEYAKHNGQEIKIATCEEMFILPSVAAECTPLPNSFDPRDPQVLQHVRFPLPRTVGTSTICSGTMVKSLDEQKHDALNHWFGGGLQISIPCSLVRTQYVLENGIRFFRNAGAHGYKVTGFAIRQGCRALIVECVDCGHKWSVLENPEDFSEYMEAKAQVYDRQGDLEREFQILEKMALWPRPAQVPV